MALKPLFLFEKLFADTSCSPLLRGDGPETTLQLGNNVCWSGTCSPLLRGDGPETIG